MKKSALGIASCVGGIVALLGLAAFACGTSNPPIFTGNAGPAPLPGVSDDAGKVPVLVGGCTGFQCGVVTCANGGTTTISGTVYDPAGVDPLYNVVVYVPAATPSAIPTGASCQSCNALYTGGVVASAVTDANGKFTITNAPAGNEIPLVVQIGKWRRQTAVSLVTPCTDNPQAKVTLPASSSEGDLPNIAISTGGADSLECLLRRIGVEASEYTPGAGGAGHIHIFQGSTAASGAPGAATMSTATPLSSEALWNSVANLTAYDIVILSCEGDETVDQPGSTPLTATDQQNLLDYTVAGGRVFASHFHYAWLNTGPFGAANIATWTRGANPITESSNNPVETDSADFVNANIVTTFEDGGPFPKGLVLDQWLTTVSALNPAGIDAPGELHIEGAKHNADLVGLTNTPSQAWIAADRSAYSEILPGVDAGVIEDAAGATEYLSFDTPFDASLDDAGEPQYCGRVVYSDLHVGAASGDYGGQGAGGIVPGGCAANPLSPQEKALEFMIFDLSSCVTADTGAAQPPPPGPLP